MNPDAMNATVSLVVLANAIVLTTISRDFPPALRPAAKDWQIGTLLIAIGAGFVATGRWLPLPLMVILTNGPLVFGLIAYRRSLRKFVGAEPKRFDWLLGVFVTLSVLAFSAIHVSFMARVVLVSAAWLWLMIDSIRLLLGPGSQSGARSQRMLAAIFALVAAFVAVRLFFFLPHDLPADFTSASQNFIANLVSPAFLVLLPTVGTTAFMLMCTDRVRRRLEVVAATDPLTGLFNRRSFGDTAADRFNKAKVAGKGFMLVLLDVDRFKAVNDTYGHEVGDKVLMHVAGRLQNVARGDDMIARLGGEEFVMLLETDDWEGGMGAAERIRQAVADQAIRVDLQDIVVTVSGGVARFDPEDRSLSDVLRRADQALYLAKSAGRNRVAARA